MSDAVRCDQCGKVEARTAIEAYSSWRHLSAPNMSFGEGGGEFDFCSLECLIAHSQAVLARKAAGR